MGYDWDFGILVPYTGAIIRGLGVSLQLAVFSTVLGTVAGFWFAFLLDWKFLGRFLTGLNDALRAVPLLVLIFFFYYFPYNQVLGLPAPSAFFAALAALSLAQLNFTAEIVRTAIAAVPAYKIDTARALGMKENRIWWQVVFPDVVRQSLPTQIAFFIGNVKLSSLASVIGTEEVVYVARIAVGQTFRSLEAWVVVAVVYITLVTPFVILGRRVEQSKWMQRR